MSTSYLHKQGLMKVRSAQLNLPTYGCAPLLLCIERYGSYSFIDQFLWYAAI